MTPAFHNFQYSVPNLCFPLFSLHFTSLKTLWLFSMTLNSLPVQHKTLLFTSMKQFDGTTVKTNKHSYQLRNDLSDRWNYFTPHEETWMYYYVFCHPQIFLTFSMKNHLYNCIEVSSEKKNTYRLLPKSITNCRWSQSYTSVYISFFTISFIFSNQAVLVFSLTGRDMT